jgi:glycosyltransferase involved in cell wall biosynthesis
MIRNGRLKPRLSYLCAAPRISTRLDAEISGPRAHILGFIQALEALKWEVKPFILGDRLPPALVTKKIERAITGGFVRALALDITRWSMGFVNARHAWRELGTQVDWVYERFVPFQSLGRIFQRHGIPWVLETHAPLFYEAKTERKTTVLSGLARRLELQAYRECDALVCVSEALKEIVIRESGIPSEKVLVVPNGVDTERFEPRKYEPKRLFAGFTLGFVGRLYSWHKLDLLLEVLQDLRGLGLDLSLVVVGDGIVREELEDQAQRLGISSNVAFIGQVPWLEVPQYIAGFDIGYIGHAQMQVGKMYHSPLKLYEYMAMAKPVVASAFEDAQRVISEGETGFLFEPGNKEDLKRALTLAYQAREQLSAMGKQARELMVAEHSWVARISAMTVNLEQILGHK